jgi:2-oxo-4-hydroxy-4-carboxy--5-ureidoimidazoline (OHCU) decarboxylase
VPQVLTTSSLPPLLERGGFADSKTF